MVVVVVVVVVVVAAAEPEPLAVQGLSAVDEPPPVRWHSSQPLSGVLALWVWVGDRNPEVRRCLRTREEAVPCT